MFQVYRDVLRLLERRERRMFFLLLGGAMVSALIEATSVAAILPLLSVLAQPELITEQPLLAFVHAALGAPDTGDFQLALAAFVFALVVLGLGFKMFNLYAINRYSSMRSYALSSRLLHRVLRQPYETFLNRHSSELGVKILAEVGDMVQRIVLPTLLLASNLLLVVFLVAVLFAAEPVVASVVALVLSTAYGAIYLSMNKVLARFGGERLTANAARFRIAQEVMEGIKQVKLRGLENDYVGRFRDPARRLARIDALLSVLKGLPRHALEIVSFGSMLLFIMVSLARTSGDIGHLVPTLGLVAFAGMRLLPALQQAFSAFATIRSGEAVLANIMQEFQLGADPPPQDAAQDRRSLPVGEAISLNAVSYRYPAAARLAVDRLDLCIPARATIGLVGGTGAGKTTAVDLILGLLVPQSGEIRVDGTPIDETNRRAWQRSIGYVPQFIFLTDQSVAANIAFGVRPEEIDMTKVETAAKIAALHDFITQDLPDGYASMIGERGVRLSGGQRQRIGIARALYTDPDLIIFDEATSALDTITERAVMEAIARLGGTKTIVMIAHRLSTVRDCDRIFLLKDGRVEASGTFTELTNTSLTFRKMVRHG